MLANIARKLITAWSIRNVPPRVSPPQPVDPENNINTEPAREQVRFSGQKQAEAGLYGQNGQLQNPSSPNLDEHA